MIVALIVYVVGIFLDNSLLSLLGKIFRLWRFIFFLLVGK